jgi:hypothetical protein
LNSNILKQIKEKVKTKPPRRGPYKPMPKRTNAKLHASIHREEEPMGRSRYINDSGYSSEKGSRVNLDVGGSTFYPEIDDNALSSDLKGKAAEWKGQANSIEPPEQESGGRRIGESLKAASEGCV